MNLHRLLTSTCLIVLISGCATVDILMVTASGVSYLVSGKSISDNIVSAVIDEDCAAHRLLLNKEICVPTNRPADMSDGIYGNDGETRIAANTSPIESITEQLIAADTLIPGQHFSNQESKQEPEQTSEQETAKQPEVYQSDSNTVIVQALEHSKQFEQLLPEEDVAALNPVHTPPVIGESEIAKNMTPPKEAFHNNSYIENPQTFVVIGSFNELAFARERQISHLALNAEVVSNLHNDKTRFRVVVGPYNELDSEQSLSQLSELEKFSPWRINLCASTMAAPPCESSVVARVEL